MLHEFEFEKPRDLQDALALIANNAKEAAEDSGHVLLAGGSNIIPAFRTNQGSPEVVIDLGGIDELRFIKVENGRVSIGGRTTISDILNHPDMPALAPALHQCSKIFAGQMVRNVATIGGNIACGSPASDSVPALLVLDAEVVLVSQHGERSVPLDEYFTGYKQTVRHAHELIAEISWPIPAANAASLFRKVGRRKGDAITVVGVAVHFVQQNGLCNSARIALGAVGPMVYRAKRAEAALVGNAISAELIDEVAGIAAADSTPIDDVRATGDYRKQVIGTVTRRLLRQAAGLDAEDGVCHD
ncbi:MAG: xanthine dehydrogenase family protein subunit M [Gammaproteobacteria bacterium]|nr:xanthine dehydrogenase family protein subunit M [Gammaproteobacteria bacterium]